MKKPILMLALAGVTAFCSFNATAQTAAKTKMAKTTGMEKKEGVMVGGAMMVPSKNIVENAVGSSDHTTLVAAVKAAGLVETLMGTGPFTVFETNNAYF